MFFYYAFPLLVVLPSRRIHFMKANYCPELTLPLWWRNDPAFKQTLAAYGWHRISFSCICVLLSVFLARWSTQRTFLSPVGRISTFFPSFLHGSYRTLRDDLVRRRSTVGMLINGSRSVRGDWWKIVIASLHWTAYSIEVWNGWDWNTCCVLNKHASGEW